MKRLKSSAPFTLLVAIGMLAGCKPNTHPPEVGSHSLSGKLGGMDYRAEIAQWGSGSVLIIITDLIGKSESGASWRPSGARWRGEFSAEGRAVAWECASADGKTGQMEIDGTQYDLAHGSLFYIGVENGRVVVKQLKRDTLNMAPNQGAIELLLKDPEVRKMVGDNGQPDPE